MNKMLTILSSYKQQISKKIYVNIFGFRDIIYRKLICVELIIACTVMAKRDKLHSNTVFLVLTLYVLIIKL